MKFVHILAEVCLPFVKHFIVYIIIFAFWGMHVLYAAFHCTDNYLCILRNVNVFLLSFCSVEKNVRVIICYMNISQSPFYCILYLAYCGIFAVYTVFHCVDQTCDSPPVIYSEISLFLGNAQKSSTCDIQRNIVVFRKCSKKTSTCDIQRNIVVFRKCLKKLHLDSYLVQWIQLLIVILQIDARYNIYLTSSSS